jgi:hypothetical protein
MWGDCTDESGNSTAIPLVSQAGGNELDITKWGARRINLTISDVQQTIQEGTANGPIVPFNILGNTIPGSQA